MDICHHITWNNSASSAIIKKSPYLQDIAVQLDFPVFPEVPQELCGCLGKEPNPMCLTPQPWP